MEDNLTINCDVAIELPNMLELPMARVEAGRFSQDQVYALFGTLCGDTQMYISPSIRDKAYYEQKILEYQAQLATETDEDSIRWYENAINNNKERYEQAPETLEITPCDGTLQRREIEGDDTGAMSGIQLMLNATSDPYNLDNPMTFCVQNDIDYNETSVYSFEDEFGNTQVIAPVSGSRFEFSREGSDTRFGMHSGQTKLTDVTALSLSGGKVEDCLLSTTPKQARNIVEQFILEAQLDELIIDNVALYTTKRAVPPVAVEEREDGSLITWQESDQEEKQAYLFRLLRQVNGVKTESCQESSETSTDGLSFGKQWYYEEMTVAVDDKGIVNVNWVGPLEVTEVLTDNTAILPFSDIAAIFEKMVVISNMDMYINPERKQQMDITHISLSLQRIMEQDSFTTGLLVPVWNFYGSITSWSNDDEKRTSKWEYMPILSVNAIDGSIIDVYKGY